MMAFKLFRVALHLFVGLATCAFYFPLVDRAARNRRVHLWSIRLVKLCGVELTVIDRAGTTPSEKGLIVANHISWLDIFVINSFHACRFVAKSDIRSWPLIGWLCHKAGTIFISRGKVRDVRRIYEGLVHSLHDGEHVAFFPEGTTSLQGTVLPFHANLFEAAVEAGVPVQPFALRYLTADGKFHPAAEFVGEMSFVESLMVILKADKVRAELIRLPFIATSGCHRRELAQTTRHVIVSVLGEATPETSARMSVDGNVIPDADIADSRQ